MIKNNKGITLIALVVTIVVLVILGGVSVYLVLGENRVVQKAKKSSEDYQLAQINEQEQLIGAEEYIQTSRQTVSNSNMSSLHSSAFTATAYGWSIGAGTRYFNSFTINTSEEFSKYMSYDSSNGNITVLKSGWYIIVSSLRGHQSGGERIYVDKNCYQWKIN